METVVNSSDNLEYLLNYPRSYASTSEGQINRSRAWSEDITKHWTVPITGLETVNERAQRYLIYFQLTSTQLKCIHNRILNEMRVGLELHREKTNLRVDSAKCSFKLLDTYIEEKFIPTGDEKGTQIVLELSSNDVDIACASQIQLHGNGKATTLAKVSQNLNVLAKGCSKGLLDSTATASMLFDSLAEITKKSKDSKNFQATKDSSVPVAFVVGFPVEHRSVSQATLIHWTKGFETGRKTFDPVEGMDIDALLQCAFQRVKLSANVTTVLNNCVAVILAGCYEKPNGFPQCCVGMTIGAGVNGCYLQPEAQINYGYKGCLINCELGSFDKSLPVNDVDLEVDFGDTANEGSQIFEKMIASTYLGELCRRLILKVWQSEAPQLAWVRHSLPWLACARIAESQDETKFEIIGEILHGLWDWETTVEQRRNVQQLFKAVFERSAALAAVAIVALSKQTGRLQPAMGGVTCAISGVLYNNFSFYRSFLQNYIELICSSEIKDCIKLHEVKDPIAKGAIALGLKINS